MDTELSLTTGKIPRLVVQIALPAATGYFFNVMFNVVDSWFAGQISTDALAGLSLSFPLYFVFIALSMGFASGASALIGNALGAEDRAGAAHLCRQVLLFGLMLSVLVAGLGVTFNERVFIWLGASGEYLAAATDYMTVLYAAAPLIMLGPLVNAGLAAQGKTRYLRNVLVTGFFANLLLDPWFIYGGFGLPAMGVRGVAVATLTVNAVGLAYLFYQLRRSGMLASEQTRAWSLDTDVIKALLRQGLPAVFGMASTGAFFFISNKYINGFGAEAVAAYGIGLRIEQLVLVSSMAVNHATLALVANNLGAGHFDRVRESRLVGLKITGGILFLGTFLMLLGAAPLMNLFSNDAQVISIGVGYLMIEAFTLPAYALIHTNGGVLQGLKRPVAVMWAGLVRAVLLPLLLLPLLLDWLGLGIEAIWWMVFALAWIVGAALMWHTEKTLDSEEKLRNTVDTHVS